MSYLSMILRAELNCKILKTTGNKTAVNHWHYTNINAEKPGVYQNCIIIKILVGIMLLHLSVEWEIKFPGIIFRTCTDHSVSNQQNWSIVLWMMYFKDKTSKFALSIIIKSLLSNLLPVDIRRDIHTGVFID